MLLATINKTRGILYLGYIGKVDPQQIQEVAESLPGILEDLPENFVLLVDMEHLVSMTKECAPGIGLLMELFDRKGVKQVIRVIPDKTKDIGLQVLYLLHYKKPPPLVVCETMVEACEVIESLE